MYNMDEPALIAVAKDRMYYNYSYISYHKQRKKLCDSPFFLNA